MAKHTYKWSDQDEYLLKRICAHDGCTQTDAIRRAIREYVSGMARDESGPYQYGPDMALLQSQVEHLRAQVEWQRRLIEQQVALIAQAQATAARALPGTDERRGGWRWPWAR